MEKLIADYRIELEEDHHSHGSGRYGVVIVLPDNISSVFPYLNSVLDDTIYDHENQVLIGLSNKRKYAFRPQEIRVGVTTDPSNAHHLAGEIVDLVNRVWGERDRIVPSTRKRKLPPVYDIFKSLPRTNCKQCGSTCLAFAARLRSGEVRLEQCSLLSQPEYTGNREQISRLFSAG